MKREGPAKGGNFVQVVDVGPRDGFQNVPEFIPTETKLEVIGRLYQAGLSKIQVTSFISPKAIPQMRDAAEVAAAAVERYQDIALFALVPNLKGGQLAKQAGLREISTVLSLSESHNKANVGKSVDESVEEMRRIRGELPDMKITQDIATVFACPFEGMMETGPLVELIGKLKDIGMDEFTLCDTIGMANPKQVERVLDTVYKAFPGTTFNIHIHDTRNMGLLNTYVAIEKGVRSVQTTLGGLGGCPFAPGASGNTATEDLVFMLQGAGYETGIDFEKLLAAAQYLYGQVDGNYSSHHIHIEQR